MNTKVSAKVKVVLADSGEISLFVFLSFSRSFEVGGLSWKRVMSLTSLQELN